MPCCPTCRNGAGGHVVVVSSYAAWRFSPHSGVAYAASKTALVALCATLNEQEAPYGVRACHLCPGEVDGDFLDLRPSVPDENARADADAGRRRPRGAVRAAVATFASTSW